MDKAITDIFTWQTILFCLGVYFVTFLIRRFVDSLIKFAQQRKLRQYEQKLRTERAAWLLKAEKGEYTAPPQSQPPQPLQDLVWWWRNFFLPYLPLFVGGLAAGLIKSYPYPSIVTGNGIRVFFGIVCGGASGMLYKTVKNALRKMGGLKVDEDSASSDDFELSKSALTPTEPAPAKEEEPTPEKKS